MKIVENFSKEVVDFMLNFDLESNSDIVIDSLCKIKTALKKTDHIKPVTFSKLTGTSVYPQKLDDFLHFLHSFMKYEIKDGEGVGYSNEILKIKKAHEDKYKDSLIKQMLGYQILYKKKCVECEDFLYEFKTQYVFNVETEREWNLVYFLRRKFANPDISYISCKNCGENSEREHEITPLITYLPNFLIFEKKNTVLDSFIDLSEYCSLDVLNTKYKFYRETELFYMYKKCN